MVTSGKQIKLLDFGLALGGVETRLTEAGHLVGSMHYVSPEIISGEPADVRSDLYAVGITLYEMFTGRLPIEGTSHAQIIANHLRHNPTAPARLNPKIPEALSAAVMKALRKDKGLRWQSASAFLRALDAVHLGGAGDSLVTSTETISLGTPAKIPVDLTASDVRPSDLQANPVGVQPEVLSDIADRLASHVGPIAKILVKRASSNAHDVGELCELVSREIESLDKRQKFLNSVQSHIRASRHQ
jgi:serine/threonine-protein kinase